MINIYDEQGTLIDLSPYGLECLSFEPESLSLSYIGQVIEGGDGELLYDENLQPRAISSSFMFQSTNYIDYKLLERQIYRLFDPRKTFVLEDTRDSGKVWKARLSGVFKPSKVSRTTGTFEVMFISPLPFSETIGTTLNPIDDMMSQVKTNYGDPQVQYQFNTSQFQVWNDSDTDIKPQRYGLNIEFRGVSSNLKIKNITTGEEWVFNGETTGEDVLKLEGIRFTKNSLSIFRQTNKKLISLQKGWNEFEITGATDFTISFDFRFYYV